MQSARSGAPAPKRSDLTDANGPIAAPVLHVAARAEDALHRFRERRGRRRGRIPAVVPFTGYGGADWIRVLGRVVLRDPDADDAGRSASLRGWRSFTSATVAGARVTIDAGDQRLEVTADRGGVIDERVAARLEPGWRRIRLTPEGGETVEASIVVVKEDVRFGVVSDIDDTVMVTALPRPLLAAWNTFVLDEHARSPVPGMAVLYDRLNHAHPDAPLIYLSTGAWNVAPTLTRFLERNLYPAGPLLLTDWGPTQTAWFRSGPQHKRTSLERLAKDFPSISWLLIGDDGQHDVGLYGEFARRHPDRVAAIAIRTLTAGEAVLAGGRSGPGGRSGTAGRGAAAGAASEAEDADGPTVPRISAPDGAGLSAKLRELGLL